MPYAKNYPFHPRPNEKELPLITPYIPGEEEILDVMFAPQKDLISEEEWFRALKNKWMLDPYGQGLFDYDEKGRNPAGNTTRDPLYEGTGLENFQLRKSDMEENMGEKKLAQEYTTKQIYDLLDEHILPGCSYNLRKDPNIDCWRVQIFNDKLLDEMGITAPYLQFHLPFVLYKKEDMIKKFKEACEDALKLEEEVKTESLKKKAVQYGELEDMAISFSPEETEKIIEKGGELMDIDYKFIKEKGLEGEGYQKLVNSNIPLSDPEANEIRKTYLNHIKEQVTEKIPAITYLLLEDNNYHLLNEALVYLDLFEPSIDNITFYHFEEYEPEKLSHKANEEQPKSRVDEMWEKMNDDEQFGCQFGMFPSWLYDEYKPTHEEIVELMGKGTPNVNASKKVAVEIAKRTAINEKDNIKIVLSLQREWDKVSGSIAIYKDGKWMETIPIDNEEKGYDVFKEKKKKFNAVELPDEISKESTLSGKIKGTKKLASNPTVAEVLNSDDEDLKQAFVTTYEEAVVVNIEPHTKELTDEDYNRISDKIFDLKPQLLEKYPDKDYVEINVIASKKLAQDFDTTKGRPTVEHDEPTQRGGEEKLEEEIGEDFFEEGEAPMGKITHAPGERPSRFPEKKPIEPERNLLKQLTPMDMKEYTAMVDERSRAEAQGDLSKADYLNNAIRELLNKYKESPGTLNEMSPASFVGRKMKAHVMLNEGDYQKVIKSVEEKLTELKRDMKLKISSASVYRIDRESDVKATVDFTMDLMMDNLNSRNIMVRAFKEGDIIEIHPYFWDSLGRQYYFDEAGIKKLFNLQRTDKKIIDEFKTKKEEK